MAGAETCTGLSPYCPRVAVISAHGQARPAPGSAGARRSVLPVAMAVISACSHGRKAMILAHRTSTLQGRVQPHLPVQVSGATAQPMSKGAGTAEHMLHHTQAQKPVDVWRLRGMLERITSGLAVRLMVVAVSGPGWLNDATSHV